MKKDNSHWSFFVQQSNWPEIFEVLLVRIGLFVIMITELIRQLSGKEEYVTIINWLVIAASTILASSLLISFLVSLFTAHAKKVKKLKDEIAASFLQAIDKSSFNPTIKRRLDERHS